MASSNLLNLAKIGQLDSVPLSVDLVKRMLASARQRRRDAELIQNSPETRFDCAYTATRVVADVALHHNGFRTSTSKPGHHQTAVQCLVHTLGVDNATVRIWDGLRKQRNLSDYDGESVTDAALQEWVRQAPAIVSRIDSVVKAHPAFRGAGA